MCENAIGLPSPYSRLGIAGFCALVRSYSLACSSAFACASSGRLGTMSSRFTRGVPAAPGGPVRGAAAGLGVADLGGSLVGAAGFLRLTLVAMPRHVHTSTGAAQGLLRTARLKTLRLYSKGANEVRHAERRTRRHPGRR